MSESERRQRTISSTPRLTPDEVAGRSFATAFRGVSETDVRAFLKRVAEELAMARSREQELMASVDELEGRIRTPKPLDEQELLDALGEETTRLLRSAREAAADIRSKAEERSARLVHDATEDASRLRQEADDVLGVRTAEAEAIVTALLEEAEQRATDRMRVADDRATEVRTAADRFSDELHARIERESAGEIARARNQGVALIEEAAEQRQRVIDDLARRRELLSGQLEELRAGRDRLLDAYRVVKRTFLEATEALAQVEARATAGRPATGTDPADLSETLAAETDAARDAGLEAVPEGADAPPVDRSGTETPGTQTPGTETPGTEDSPTDESPAAVDESETAASDAAGAEESPDSEVTDGAPEGSATDVAVVDGPPVDAGTPVAEQPGPDADPEGANDDGSASTLPDVDDLFARLRAGAQGDGSGDAAGTEDAADETASTPAREPKVSTKDSGRVDVTEDDDDAPPAWLTVRDAALAPLRVALVRQVKLAIGNEQNQVLDQARRHKGRPAAASILPEVDAQAEMWSGVIATAVTAAYRAARADDGDAAVPDDLVAGLARTMVEPLRERLVSAIDGAHEPGETSNQVAERIGARYREWKNRSAETSSDDVLVAAYARGGFDAAADGTTLAWRTPPAGCCPDCADNVLEPTAKGEAFPTGQQYPPAHPGCRCGLTVSVVVDLESGATVDAGSSAAN